MKIQYSGGAGKGGFFSTSDNRYREDFLIFNESLTILADGHAQIDPFIQEGIIENLRNYIYSEDFLAFLREGIIEKIKYGLYEWCRNLHETNFMGLKYAENGTTLSVALDCNIQGFRKMLLFTWGDSSIVYQTKDNNYHYIGDGNADNFEMVKQCNGVIPYRSDNGLMPVLVKGGIAYNDYGQIAQKFDTFEDFEEHIFYSDLKIEDLQREGFISDLDEFRKKFEAGEFLPNPVARYRTWELMKQNIENFPNGFQSCGSGVTFEGIPWANPNCSDPRRVYPNIGSQIAGGQIINGIGDKCSKNILSPMIAYMPEIAIIDPTIIKKMIVASDGVWDVLTREEAFLANSAEEMQKIISDKMKSNAIFSGLVQTDDWGNTIWYHDDVSFVVFE